MVKRLVLFLTLFALAVPAAHAATALTAPTKTVKLARQTVGYRSFGTGTPLVFVMGLSGSMDSWDPTFLDALAPQHRIVLVDNEGVGKTTALPGRLSIRRMADTTAALMTRLRLRGAGVAGWSMGGMIAQSLAARHPKLVRHLILLATAPGDGHATAPSPAVLNTLTGSGDPLALLGLLFPAEQTAVRDAYIAHIFQRQPNEGLASAMQQLKQLQASSAWMLGSDPDGKKLFANGSLRPMVGGGQLDPLLPYANDVYLAAHLRGADLKGFADASHGFLFQHQDEVVADILHELTR